MVFDKTVNHYKNVYTMESDTNEYQEDMKHLKYFERRTISINQQIKQVAQFGRAMVKLARGHGFKSHPVLI